MKFVAIVAENPNSALVQVHEQLGPEAIIVSVRKMQSEGISWLWPNRRKIEVTACVPEKSVETKRETPQKNERTTVFPGNRMALQKPALKPSDGRWRSITWLESNGLLPAFTNQLEEKVYKLYGEKPLPTMQKEWSAI